MVYCALLATKFGIWIIEVWIIEVRIIEDALYSILNVDKSIHETTTGICREFRTGFSLIFRGTRIHRNTTICQSVLKKHNEIKNFTFQIITALIFIEIIRNYDFVRDPIIFEKDIYVATHNHFIFVRKLL